jgi:hypothetical protein
MAVVAISYYEKIIRAAVGINDSEARSSTFKNIVETDSGGRGDKEEEAVEKENMPEKINTTGPKSHEEILLMMMRTPCPSFPKCHPHNEKPITPPSPQDASSLLI